MKWSESVKPISYFKAHASEVLKDVSSKQKTMVITQNGEAKAVLQDVRVYEQTQESLAMLKILAISKNHLEKGNIKTVQKSFEDIQRRIQGRKPK